jgi:hypothetical protein
MRGCCSRRLRVLVTTPVFPESPTPNPLPQKRTILRDGTSLARRVLRLSVVTAREKWLAQALTKTAERSEVARAKRCHCEERSDEATSCPIPDRATLAIAHKVRRWQELRSGKGCGAPVASAPPERSFAMTTLRSSCFASQADLAGRGRVYLKARCLT